MRQLATVRRVKCIRPIEGADRIEKAIIDAWPVVVRKGDFVEGQLVIFCEIDSIIPANLSHTGERLRIKTVRLRGQLSQGYILSLDAGDHAEGTDVTQVLGIEQHTDADKFLPTQAKGSFPSFIPKTDEPRVQNLRDLRELSGTPFFCTEKLDGTSFTAYNNQGDIGVCSRNMELRDGENLYWRVARSSGALDALQTADYVAIQGEICGPGIQGNRYNLTEPELFVFNIFDIAANQYMSKSDVYEFCRSYALKMVPYVGIRHCPDNADEILQDAESVSQLNTDVQREGVVWVCDGETRVSFKAISNRFLLGE